LIKHLKTGFFNKILTIFCNIDYGLELDLHSKRTYAISEGNNNKPSDIYILCKLTYNN